MAKIKEPGTTRKLVVGSECVKHEKREYFWGSLKNQIFRGQGSQKGSGELPKKRGIGHFAYLGGGELGKKEGDGFLEMGWGGR